MNSGIELELGAINWHEWLLHPILFPGLHELNFEHRTQYLTKHLLKISHLKVCMIIISCWDSTLHFNVFITTHMGALVRLWKGGTTFEQLGGTKMTVWQPFIPTWMAKSGEPSPGNLKVQMSKRVHFRPLFPKLAKNYSCYEGEYWHWINE